MSGQIAGRLLRVLLRAVTTAVSAAGTNRGDVALHRVLIDSGASVTVIAKRYLDEFQILDRKALGPNERYSAANDTPVSVFERVRIRALLPMYEGQQYLGLISVYVTGVVADVAHNILSTEQMVRTGWEVKFTRKEISLRHSMS